MKKYFDYRVEGVKTNSISVEVRYLKGGYNVFTSERESRGIWLIICPVVLERHNLSGVEYVSEQYTAFSGNKICLKELSRKSEKQLQIVVDKMEPIAEELALMFRQGLFAELQQKAYKALAG